MLCYSRAYIFEAEQNEDWESLDSRVLAFRNSDVFL